jgi:hypothetical protein
MIKIYIGKIFFLLNILTLFYGLDVQAQAPVNDLCSNAISLTPQMGCTYTQYTNLNATESATDPNPSCGGTFAGGDVWFKIIVPASGNINITTNVGQILDGVMALYSGNCNALIEIACDDDGGPTGANGLMSLLPLTAQTPGSTVYIGVWKYGTTAPSVTENGFRISAYDASLGNNSFDNTNFSYYPNPVKNTLNLSYNQEISNVEVFNLLGQKVSSNVINANAAQIDMSNLATGSYLVKVTSDNKIKTIKVIKR